MTEWVECVPNFSNGRDDDVIAALADALGSVGACRLIGVDSGKSANRTVCTVVGPANDVAEAAFRATRVALDRIDMNAHDGVHRCFGAADVVPFIPIADCCMPTCVRLAHQLAARVSNELMLPVYMYGHAATRPERQHLPAVRRKTFGDLGREMQRPGGGADYGPHMPHPTAGAVAIGARPLLIAYNVNLDVEDAHVAKRIARQIRSRSVGRQPDPPITVEPLAHCMADGWTISEYGCAQVTMNLTRFEITGLHHAYERVCEAAAQLGVGVKGSEIVGLAPEKALVEAGLYFESKCRQPDANPPTDAAALIEVATRSLGLSAVRPFYPGQQVLEHALVFDGPSA